MPASIYLATFLLGLAGGIHCAGMCGGFMLAMHGASVRPVVVVRNRWQRWLPILAANAGRLTTYVALGAAAGLVGGSLLLAARRWPVQTALFGAANVLLLVTGLLILTRGSPVLAGLSGRIERLVGAGFGALAPSFAKRLTASGSSQRFMAGLAWGLVPCGLIYSALPVAAMAGNPLEGGLLMLAFGAGTLPNVLLAGALLSHWRGHLARPLLRVAMAVALIAFGTIGLLRAFGWLSGMPGASFFC